MKKFTLMFLNCKPLIKGVLKGPISIEGKDKMMIMMKGAIKGVFRRSYCCYGNLLCYENDSSMVINDWAVF